MVVVRARIFAVHSPQFVLRTEALDPKPSPHSGSLYVWPNSFSRAGAAFTHLKRCFGLFLVLPAWSRARRDCRGKSACVYLDVYS